MAKKKTKKKTPKKVLKYEVGDKLYFRKPNGEWGFGIVDWIQRNTSGNRYFLGQTKYADSVFEEEYLFTEKQYKKLSGAKDG